MKAFALSIALITSAAVAQTTYPMTIRHDAGTTVLTKKPLRIVALQEEAAELAQALNVKLVGFGGRLNGIPGARVTQHGYLNMTVLGQPAFVGTGLQPSLEVLTALKPDLIIASTAPALKTLYPQLSKIAPTLLWNENADPINTWRTPLRETARALGRANDGSKVITQIDATIAQYRTQLAPYSRTTPRVTPLYLYGPGAIAISSSSAFANLLNRLGFTATQPRSLTMPPNIGGVEVSSEGLVNLPADWVLISRAANEGQYETNTPYDLVLQKQKYKLVDLHMPEDIGGAGPVLELYNARRIVQALTGK